MRCIQENSTGKMLACSSEYQDQYPNTDIVELSVSFTGNEFTFAGDKDQDGTYHLTNQGPDGAIYDLTYESGETAYAVYGITKLYDGVESSAEETLIINDGNYTIYFVPET